jgi:signal transduction histidine kinase/CheY-like chemotaxis protein
LQDKIPTLIHEQKTFLASKKEILQQWVSYDSPKEILKLHKIDEEYFLQKYASGVFDYFMGVISGEMQIGNCPVMQELLAYLKFREIAADELFEICSHFRRSMVDFSYDAKLNSKELFDEISYIFDQNFRGILKFYTDTIFQKLIDARQEAVQAGQAKEYFLSNMSHEIRTPLNAILGFVNLLIDEDVSQKHRTYLDIIQNSGENLLSIINDILDFSKLRSGEFTIEPKTFSLHDELSHTMELFVASANSKDITIVSFVDPQIPKEIYADPLRIKQILSNFLSNAIKFTPANGIINVEASLKGEILKVSVKDSGIGIQKKDITKIFSAFTQAQYSEHKDYAGTGLGLSICHQLAKHMGGSVYVSSTLHKGSTFWVEVPIKIQKEEFLSFEDIDRFKKLKMELLLTNKKTSFQLDSFVKYAEIFEMDFKLVDTFSDECDVGLFVHEEISKAQKEKVLKSQSKFIVIMSKQYDDYDAYEHIYSTCLPLYCSKLYIAFKELLSPRKKVAYSREHRQRFQGHILVAEDNEANQELIKIVLEKYGLTLDLAVNGFEAVELYKKNKYDLILMDEQMPIMDGNEAVQKILSYENAKGLSHTPVSALTANVIKGAKERGLLSGFDAFLGKPIVLKELERVLALYLKPDALANVKEQSTQGQKPEEDRRNILGLDKEKLLKELMLSEEELLMLLKLFLKKMQKSLPELKNAIDLQDYKQIALIAHSIKGSSGNFRIDSLQKLASEMETMAKSENKTFAYAEVLNKIQKEIENIKII